METLSFPGLGLEFELTRTAFTVFGHPIQWYGVMIAVAFLAGSMYTMVRVKEFGLDGDRFMDLILGGVLLGIAGARLYYVAFSWSESDWAGLADDPVRIFRVWEGGIAIYGGLIGAAVAVLILCRVRRVKLLPALDLAVGGIILGQAVGRWGNFINIEAFGSNTNMPWGMTSPTVEWYLQQNKSALAAIGVTVDPSMPVHPTFFYESVWCLLGFLLILWYTKRRRFDGELALIYCGWYGLGRAFIEGLRTDSLLMGSIRVSQLLAILCVVAAALALVAIRSRIRREGDPDFMPLYVNTDEGKAVLAGEFYKTPEKTVEAKDVSGQGEDGEAVDSDTAETEESASEETETDDEPKKEADSDGGNS